MSSTNHRAEIQDLQKILGAAMEDYMFREYGIKGKAGWESTIKQEPLVKNEQTAQELGEMIMGKELWEEMKNDGF